MKRDTLAKIIFWIVAAAVLAVGTALTYYAPWIYAAMEAAK